MFSVYYSVHVVKSHAQYIRDRIQHTYSVYFSVHYDRERDERTCAVLAGTLAWPEKS